MTKTKETSAVPGTEAKPMITEGQVAEVADVAPPGPPADAMVAMLERVLTDTSLPVERLKDLLDIKKEFDDNEARKEYAAAMALAQGEMPVITRDRDNDQTRSRYATLSAIYLKAKPIAASHGFSFDVMPIESDKENMLAFEWTNTHAGGHSVTGCVSLPSDTVGIRGSANKTALHGFGSTLKYARRYLFCALYDIADQDGDDDGNAGGGNVAETINEDQFIELTQLLDSTSTDIDRFKKAYGIPPAVPIEMFPAKSFVAAKAQLIRKAEQMSKAAGDLMGEE